MEDPMHNRRVLAGLTMTGILVAACGGGGASVAPTTAGAGATQPAATTAAIPTADPGTWPDELVIGFVPSSEAGALVEDIKPLADYLSAQLGISVEGFVSNDYTGLVTAMQSGQAQIGALPPYGLVQAVDQAGAEVILQ